MLRAVPKGLFSWDFTVSLADRVIADVDMSWFREKGELEVEGQRYAVYREGLMSGRFVLSSQAGVLAEAEKPSAFFRSFDVAYRGRHYRLGALSMLTRGFGLTADSTLVGTIQPVSIFGRTTTIDLPDEVVLPVQVFMFWLVLILWKRSKNASMSD